MSITSRPSTVSGVVEQVAGQGLPGGPGERPERRVQAGAPGGVLGALPQADRIARLVQPDLGHQRHRHEPGAGPDDRLIPGHAGHDEHAELGCQAEAARRDRHGLCRALPAGGHRLRGRGAAGGRRRGRPGGWLPPGRAPDGSPVPAGLLDWFGPARPTWRSTSARPNRASWCGPGPRTTPSAAGSGCRRSRRPCTGGTLRTRWGRPSPSTRTWPPTPLGRPSSSWRRCGGPWRWRRRAGRAVPVPAHRRAGHVGGRSSTGWRPARRGRRPAGHPDLGYRLRPGAVPLAADAAGRAGRAGRHVPARPLLHPGAAPVGKSGPMARADGTSVRCAAGAARQG